MQLSIASRKRKPVYYNLKVILWYELLYKIKMLKKKRVVVFFSFFVFKIYLAFLALISQYLLSYIMEMLLAFIEILAENLYIHVFIDKHGTKK